MHVSDDNNILFAYAGVTAQNSFYKFVNDDTNVSDIPTKKITLGDIDIAYKIFGKGEFPLVLKGA